MEQFKIRCSAIGEIMANDKSGKNMGKTAQTYCKMWVKEQLYNRKKQINSKYLTKGIECESESIDYINGLFLTNYEKNVDFFSDKHLTGTPDIIAGDLIIDIKNSWSWETFPLFEKGMPTDYYYQLQGYMALTGATKGKIIYTLINMPIELATKEGWRAGYDMDDIEQHEAFIASVTYDDLPADLRVKEFDCERDDEVIEAIRSRVVECRNYIGGLGYVN